MINKIIISLVIMILVLMITGTDKSLLGKVGEKNIALMEDGKVMELAVNRAEPSLAMTSTIQYVSPEEKHKPSVEALSYQNEEPSHPEISAEDKSRKHTIAEITAYTAGYESTGKSLGDPAYGITASGKQVKENHTMACPKSLKFGTRIYVEKMQQIYTCEDRGSMITEGKLDIYIADLKEARKFGRQKLDVQILSFESSSSKGSGLLIK